MSIYLLINGGNMSLKDFVDSVWSKDEKELRDIEGLNKLLEQLRRQENEIYIVSVQSNQ